LIYLKNCIFNLLMPTQARFEKLIKLHYKTPTSYVKKLQLSKRHKLDILIIPKNGLILYKARLISFSQKLHLQNVR